MAEIGVGLVGYKFMGRAHSNAYRQVAHFFDVDPAPRMVAICGRDEAGVRAAAAQLGWEGYETDYRKLDRARRHRAGRRLDDRRHPPRGRDGRAGRRQARPLRKAAGEHAGRSAGDARRPRSEAGRRSAMVNFNYRRVPAVQFAKKLIDEGRLGEMRHWRAVYLQDWINDPSSRSSGA